VSAVLEVRGARYVLPEGRVLVADVSFGVAAGETLVLLGRSGSGKTTTLKLINRLLEPTAGEIRVAGQLTHALEATRLRRGIGYVIQEIGLFPHFTVERNVGATRTSCRAGSASGSASRGRWPPIRRSSCSMSRSGRSIPSRASSCSASSSRCNGVSARRSSS